MKAVIPTRWFVPVFGLFVVLGRAEPNSELEYFHFRMPQSATFAVAAEPAAQFTGIQRPLWLSARRLHSTNAPVQFGSRVVVQVRAPKDLPRLLQRLNLRAARTITPTLVLVQLPDARTAARLAQRLAALPQVRASYPVVRRPVELNGPYAARPTDLFYNFLWPLEQRNEDGTHAGVDLNVRAAWPFTRGEGVTIAVGDTGVELGHQDLASRASGAPHFNFSSLTTNGLPFKTTATWAHGTEVAGLAAAQMNFEPQIAAGDFTAFAALLEKLMNQADPVSAFLWNAFTPTAQSMLNDANATTDLKQFILLEQLNRLLAGDSIYEPARFAGVALSPETQSLLGSNPQGDARALLNRLLLEDAYPAELAKSANHKTRIVGVAPRARLASWVIFETNANNLIRVSDEVLMDMYQYRSNEVAVQNHSWNNSGLTLSGPTLLEEVGLSNALTHGRHGRGVIMVRAAGNRRQDGGNANEDGYANDPRVIAAAAVRFDGRTASYSEPGACVLVAAPSGDRGLNGLLTTDLKGTHGVNAINFFPPNEDLSDYVFNQMGFSGTSAAAPQIAGLAALLLSANPNLTRRDVQQLLLLSARHFDPADPDLVRNGAGLWVSHNDGFGVPDAGWAVRLARGWPNRPPATSVTFTATSPAAIPDDGLRVLVTGPGVPTELQSIRTLPGTGPHADEPTPALRLVDAGLATNAIGANLTNRGALIQRGGNNFDEKINLAAAAGAAFVVIYNFATNETGSGAPGGDQLTPLGGTDFVPIPAVFIGHTDGAALRALIATNHDAVARIHLDTTKLTFNVTDTLLCEHVALRVQTDHSLRGDLRITLVSPAGTRSVLQRFNSDTNAGPVDWTYTSTHHFYESTAGEWSADFSDEFQGATGTVLAASLTLTGVPITDADRDGLDDHWETRHFASLSQGPADDPDRDGAANMREQLTGTNPTVIEVPFKLDLSRWNENRARLSWPGSSKFTYEVWAGANAAALTLQTNLPGQFPETEWFTRYETIGHEFFQVHAVPVP